MAMHNGILLAEEVRQLWAENAKQKKKRARRRRFIATGGTLTVQEGLALSEPTIEPVVEAIEPIIGVEGGVASDEPIVRTRAPRTCSICRSLSHTAHTCPLKQVS